MIVILLIINEECNINIIKKFGNSEKFIFTYCFIINLVMLFENNKDIIKIFCTSIIISYEGKINIIVFLIKQSINQLINK